MSKTRIIDAVTHLDLQETRALLERDPSLIDVTDSEGRTLLMLACAASCSRLQRPESAAARMAAFLVDRGLDLESTVGKDSCTPLWFAVARGRNRTVVKLLLKRGAKPTGLYAAGWYEDLDILDTLIRAGARIDEPAGETPFLACWKWKKFESAKLLARQGADVNTKDRKGKTALHYGVEKGLDPLLLRFLVQHGASPDIEDREGRTARLMASRKRDKRFLEALT